MFRKVSIILFVPFIFISCFKTSEEIRREKMVDQQLEQSSKIIANLTSEITELKTSIASTSGQIEEIDFKTTQSNQKQEQTFQESLKQLQEQVKVLISQNEEKDKEIDTLKTEINSLKSYVNNVNKSLNKIIGPTKKSSASKLQQAHRAYEKNQQAKAINLYKEVLSENKINAAQRNHVFYNLGLLHYWKKDFNQSLVYFSKIYTKYPKSSFAARSLYYIGLNFKRLGKTDESKASFQELIQNYPKSSQAKKAKKEL